MGRYRTFTVVSLACLLAVVGTAPTFGQGAPQWRDPDLAGFSRAVLTGRVVDVTSAWDDAVDSIYTYVTLEVGEVAKGEIDEGYVVLKQLGGQVGDVVLGIGGQARFEEGEDVLVFLERRPRDGTLYTTALWQGKWSVEGSGANALAVRRNPDVPAGIGIFGPRPETRPLRPFLEEIRGWGRRERTRGGDSDDEPFVVVPPEAEIEAPDGDRPSANGEFSLLIFGNGLPYRWHPTGSAVPIDYDGGQPGLADWLTQLFNAAARWNGIGGPHQWGAGVGRSARCFGSFEGDQRVAITHMDPCGEISNAGGTLAIGGGFANTGDIRNINGQNFMGALQGGIVANDSSTALFFLVIAACYSDIMAHELGHVLGLGHSGDAAALMFPTLDNACQTAYEAGALAGGITGTLGADDINGYNFIYPGGGPPPPGDPPDAPTNLTGSATGSTVNLSWNAPALVAELPGGTPTSYVIEAGSSSGASDLANFDTGSTATSFSAGGVPNGTYFIRVRAKNSAGTSGPSNEVSVTVGGGGPPSPDPPDAPTSLMGSATGSTINLSWTAPAFTVGFLQGGAPTSYVIEAGSSSGAADLANFDTGSTATSFSAGGVPDGTYFIRVRARNSAGTSGPSNEVSVTVGGGPGPCTAAPGAPTGLTGSATGSTVNLNWSQGGGDAPTSYVIEAGSSSGAADLANFDTGSTATSFSAPGVPDGTYFIRVRGRNSCGTSGPSNEVAVTVLTTS